MKSWGPLWDPELQLSVGRRAERAHSERLSHRQAGRHSKLEGEVRETGKRDW